MAIETRKFSEFADAGDLEPNQETVGVNSGINVQYNNPFPLLPPGSTADRPAIAPSMYYRLRFNTTLESYEYYSPVTMTWIQLEDSGDLVDAPFVIYTADATLPSAFNLGTLSSGMLRQSVLAGVATPAIAVNGVDYYGPDYTGFIRAPAGIQDINSNEVIGFSTVGASAVNYLNVTNSIAGQPVTYNALGSDTNIGIQGTTKADGVWNFRTTASVAAFNFASGTGYQHISQFTFFDTAATRTYIWPDASGTIALSAGGGIVWNNISGTSQAAVIDNGYVATNASQTTVTLPAIAPIGSVVCLEGLGAGGWILQANTGQTIQIGSSVTSSAGTLTSAAATDNVYVVSVVANTTWRVQTTNSTGLTVA